MTTPACLRAKRWPITPVGAFSAARGLFAVSIALISSLAFAAANSAANDHEVNWARNRLAYQSGAADDDHSAHLATDGSAKTYWQSDRAAGAWWAVDLGAPRRIDWIEAVWGPHFASAFRIEVAGDELHPQRWDPLTTEAQGSGGTQAISLPKPTVARHIRIVVDTVSDGNSCELCEFRAFGPGDEMRSERKPVGLVVGADGAASLDGDGWTIQNAMFVEQTGERIATPAYDDQTWLPAAVPGTVLGSYVADGAVPNPWYGDQMSQISEEFFSHHDFWYRESFVGPAFAPGKTVWLRFEGINWKAEVFLNGKKLGRIDGAFTRARFDASAVIRPQTDNVLAVLIHHTAHPGPGPHKVTHKKLGGRTTNGDVLGYDSPTFISSAGWNWVPIIRGRDIGIWNHVLIETTGEVTVDDPWVTTERLAPDYSSADLAVHAEVRNHGANPVAGKLVGKIDGSAFEMPLTLGPGENRHVDLTAAQSAALAISHPRVWWPNEYGDQPLSTLSVRFEAAGQVSDSKSVKFGIRTIDYRIVDNVLRFEVNGRPILLRGGNWGMDEGMLRCDAAGYDLRLRLHHDAHFNMIRNWVGMTARSEFYDACDRYGILVWDDFWMGNPRNGPEPTDNALFMADVREKIRQVRSHPSVALYCGRNEGYPPEELDIGMRDAVVELDGRRLYLPHSAANIVTGRGPYEVQDPEWYFANRGRTMHSELGIVAVPTVESMRAMMPAEYLWPINDMWAVHDYQTGRSPLYTKRIDQRYGTATGIEDYCRKAQLVNLESAKAMFESLRANRGSGTLLWMTQSAWPSLICQIYDYYFEPTGAYFGAKSACEPIHVFWNALTDQIEVANDSLAGTAGTVNAEAFDLTGHSIWRHSASMKVDANAVAACFAFRRPENGPYFLHLSFTSNGTLVSDNFYWGAKPGETCAKLQDMPQVELPASIAARRDGEVVRVAVDVANPGATVALAIRLQVLRASDSERVLPVLYDDNYFSLVPGEHRTVNLEIPAATLGDIAAEVVVGGWNVRTARHALNAAKKP